MADGSAGPGFIRRLVDTAWSAGVASADPDDPLVRAFADFGLPSYSPLATEDQLRDLEAWRDDLRIPANSAFLDGTLLMTVDALLGRYGPERLTPVTLWELTAFIDALVCFDQLYCVANPAIDVSGFNRRLGEDVLTVIPDPNGGMLRRLAAWAAANGLSEMESLRVQAGHDDAFGQEVQAVVGAWRAVFGPDFPSDGPFDMTGIDTRLARMAARAAPGYETSSAPYDPRSGLSAEMIDGEAPVATVRVTRLVSLLVWATRHIPAPSDVRPSERQMVRRARVDQVRDEQEFAATATYRT